MIDLTECSLCGVVDGVLDLCIDSEFANAVASLFWELKERKTTLFIISKHGTDTFIPGDWTYVDLKYTLCSYWWSLCRRIYRRTGCDNQVIAYLFMIYYLTIVKKYRIDSDFDWEHPVLTVSGPLGQFGFRLQDNTA